MGRGNRPADDGVSDPGARVRADAPPEPFTPPTPPPAAPEAAVVEALRLVVVLHQRGRRDYLAGVTREPGEIKLAGCRATDPFAAVQGACAAAVEVLRAEARR